MRGTGYFQAGESHASAQVCRNRAVIALSRRARIVGCTRQAEEADAACAGCRLANLPVARDLAFRLRADTARGRLDGARQPKWRRRLLITVRPPAARRVVRLRRSED